MAVVYVAVNTTGFGKNQHVLQIAAKCGNRELNVYVASTQGIHFRAAEANRLQWDDGELYHDNKLVRPQPAEEAITQFVSFVQRCGGGEGCVLVSHQASFDAPHVLKLAAIYNLYDDLRDACPWGYADSLKAFREEYPHFYSHSLPYMVEQYLPYYNGQLHSSLKKVRALDELVSHLGVSTENFFDDGLHFAHYFNNY